MTHKCPIRLDEAYDQLKTSYLLKQNENYAARSARNHMHDVNDQMYNVN